MQRIILPTNNDKKKTPICAFALKSGKVLLRQQHQTSNFVQPTELFPKEYGDEKLTYSFTVYDPKSKTSRPVGEAQYKCADLPGCYLPQNPLLLSLNDEICLNPKDQIKSLFLSQPEEFYTYPLGRLAIKSFTLASLPESNQYVSRMLLSNQLVIYQQKESTIRTLQKYFIPECFDLQDIVSLSSNLLCVNCFGTFYLLHREDEYQKFTVREKFTIEGIVEHSIKELNLSIINALSNHEILAYANMKSIIKIDLQLKKKVDEFILPKGEHISSSNCFPLLVSPMLFIITGNEMFYLFDSEKMVLFPLTVPAECPPYRFHGAMPDGKLLLAKDNSIFLFEDPTLKEIFALRNKIMEPLLDPLKDITPLANIVTEYVENDISIKLSTHFASFYQRKEIIRSLASSTVPEDKEPYSHIKLNN